MRIIEFFDGAESSTTPTIGNISASDIVEFASDAAYEAANSGAPTTGNIYLNTTDNRVRYYDGTAWIEVGRTIEIQENASDIADLRTTTGTSDGDTNMGTYTGSTLNDNESVKQNIQQLETEIENLPNVFIPTAEKGAANGVAELDGSGLVPASQLPSYVDDVEEYADLASFPVTGETGKIYIALDTNFMYRWSGSVYIDITSKVDSVNGQTGAVVLDTDDISEGATNLYYTEARVSANTDVAANTAKVSAAGSIDTHSDVDTTSVAPVVGEALVWNGSNWVPGEVSGGGSGEGGINYITNSQFEDDTAGWNSYDDGAVTPVDGTGGSPLGSISHDTTDPLRDIGSLAATIPHFEGISTDFTIDDADKVNQLEVSFDYNTDTGTFNPGDMKVYIYDITNASMTELANSSLDPQDPSSGSGSNRFYSTYTTTESTSYRLLIHNNTGESARDINIDNVRVGPLQQPDLSSEEIFAVRVNRATSPQAIGSSAAVTVIFNNIDYGNASYINTGTGEVTVPFTGKYLVNTTLKMSSYTSSDTHTLRIRVNGGTERDRSITNPSSSISNTFTSIMDLTAGDVVTVATDSTADTSYNVDNSSSTFLEIIQIPDLLFSNHAGPHKTQDFFLTSDVTTDTTMSDLTMSNLSIGQWYSVKLQAAIQIGNTVDNVSVVMYHDGSPLATATASEDNTSGSLVKVFTIVAEFQATATTVTFDSSSVGPGSAILGDSTKFETFANISTIAPKIVTTEFS